MFSIIEQQTNNGVTAIVTPIPVIEDRNEAESRFHTVLAAAAISSCEVHSCTVLDERGVSIMTQCYSHPVNPSA